MKNFTLYLSLAAMKVRKYLPVLNLALFALALIIRANPPEGTGGGG